MNHLASILSNWKTTLGGVISIVIGVASLFGVTVTGQPALDPTASVGMIVAGVTLVFAKDHNK